MVEWIGHPTKFLGTEHSNILGGREVYLATCILHIKKFRFLDPMDFLFVIATIIIIQILLDKTM